MLIPSSMAMRMTTMTSLSRRVNANSQHYAINNDFRDKLIKKGEC